VNTVEPPDRALEIETNVTPDDVNSLSHSELIAFAQRHGIEIPERVATPPGLPSGATTPPEAS
jgi:hypothetical protein